VRVFVTGEEYVLAGRGAPTRVAEGREFDIFQTAAGYSAVTNPVRRKILEALEKGEQELGDLVKVTGKSKPTLSNLHMRELLEQRLIEEQPHPTDARRKIYRLAARRIGSSNVPLEQLRGAVKHYVSLSPLAYAVPFPRVLDVLAVEGKVDARMLREQSRALGEKASSLFAASDVRDVLTAVAGFWEREGVARTTKLDFDKLEMEVQPLDALAARPAETVAVLLAGIVEGVLRSRLQIDSPVATRTRTGRVTLTYPRP
jgi:DNA-binding transcriptional ArsR family regulator